LPLFIKEGYYTDIPKVVGSNPTSPTSNDPLGVRNVVRGLGRVLKVALHNLSDPEGHGVLKCNIMPIL